MKTVPKITAQVGYTRSVVGWPATWSWSAALFKDEALLSFCEIKSARYCRTKKAVEEDARDVLNTLGIPPP